VVGVPATKRDLLTDVRQASPSVLEQEATIASFCYIGRFAKGGADMRTWVMSERGRWYPFWEPPTTYVEDREWEHWWWDGVLPDYFPPAPPNQPEGNLVFLPWRREPLNFE
jgi:hypothetical protein